MAFALYDSWRRVHILRNQVNSEGFLKQVQTVWTPESVTTPAESGGPTEAAASASSSKRNSVDKKKCSPGEDTKRDNKNSLGELRLSTFTNAGWNMDTTPMEKMVEFAGEGGGGGCVPIVYSEDQVRRTRSTAIFIIRTGHRMLFTRKKNLFVTIILMLRCILFTYRLFLGVTLAHFDNHV